MALDAIDHIILTHHHPDHFLGNQAFAGTPIAALAVTRQGIAAGARVHICHASTAGTVEIRNRYDFTNLKDLVRTIPDYPKPGIMFRDITTLIKDPVGFRLVIDTITQRYIHENYSFNVIVGIESRGFIIGGALAYTLGKGFVPIRKKVEYQDEFGLPGTVPSYTAQYVIHGHDIDGKVKLTGSIEFTIGNFF